MLESRLEALFRQEVRKAGGYTIKLAPTERGVPDRLAMFPHNRIYLVELKTETGVLSRIQRYWHHHIEETTGVHVHVLRGISDIRQWVAWVRLDAYLAGSEADSEDLAALKRQGYRPTPHEPLPLPETQDA